MDTTMTFATQHIWTWWIAVYLYLGGLGAATLVVTFLTDMSNRTAIWYCGAPAPASSCSASAR